MNIALDPDVVADRRDPTARQGPTGRGRGRRTAGSPSAPSRERRDEQDDPIDQTRFPGGRVQRGAALEQQRPCTPSRPRRRRAVPRAPSATASILAPARSSAAARPASAATAACGGRSTMTGPASSVGNRRAVGGVRSRRSKTTRSAAARGYTSRAVSHGIVGEHGARADRDRVDLRAQPVNVSRTTPRR